MEVLLGWKLATDPRAPLSVLCLSYLRQPLGSAGLSGLDTTLQQSSSLTMQAIYKLGSSILDFFSGEMLLGPVILSVMVIYLSKGICLPQQL